MLLPKKSLYVGVECVPVVSVIIPVYKVEKYLKRCLDSVLAQTFCEWEAICVDDGSPDNCGLIIDQYAKYDYRFKTIHQNNQGLSQARNNGKKIAAGEYIYFLDSDDALHPQALEFAIRAIKDNNADLVCFNYEDSNGTDYSPISYNYNNVKYKVTSNPVFQGASKSGYGISFNVWNKLFSRELVSDINFIPDIHFEDYPFTYAVLAKRPNTVILRSSLYYYTQRNDNISRSADTAKRIQDYAAGIEYIYQIYKNPDLKKELAFIKRNFIPVILKHQLGRCRRASAENQPAMWSIFAQELVDLHKKGLLSWRGHKLTRYLLYKKLIRGAK